MRSRATCAIALAVALLAAASAVRAAEAEATAPEGGPDAAWVEGYAVAVLERDESPGGFTVDYRDGTLHVSFVEAPDAPYDALLRRLLTIEGVRAVAIDVAGERVAARERPPAHETAAATAGGTPSEEEHEGRWDFFRLDELFDPLLADPRWPRFSASHLWYFEDEELERVGAANFGETFVLVRSPKDDAGQWEIAFQAGVFSVFDLEASSSDLVNADYLVGVNFTHHYKDLKGFVRIYHQSSHLGDEYLLRNRVDRINLSFEVIDALLSFEATRWMRLYAGGGVIIHREPAIDRGILQGGTDLTSPIALANGFLRPLLSVDLQMREESDWRVDASVRGGVQIEHPTLKRSRLQILAEFYSGRSPNGQFYDRRIRSLGLGVHLGF